MKAILKLINQEELLPGNLASGEMDKMYKLLYQGHEAKANSYYYELLEKKLETRKKVLQPIEKLTKQLKTERAAFRDTNKRTPNFMYKRMREWMMTTIEDEKYEETRSKAPATVPCYDSDGDLLPELIENEDNLEYKRYSKKKQPSSAAHKEDETNDR